MQPESWDHYTHVRLAWAAIKLHGIQGGFEVAQRWISGYLSSPPPAAAVAPSSGDVRGSGDPTAEKKRSFHCTLTRFWAHMVTYLMLEQRRHSCGRLSPVDSEEGSSSETAAATGAEEGKRPALSCDTFSGFLGYVKSHHVVNIPVMLDPDDYRLRCDLTSPLLYRWDFTKRATRMRSHCFPCLRLSSGSTTATPGCSAPRRGRGSCALTCGPFLTCSTQDLIRPNTIAATTYVSQPMQLFTPGLTPSFFIPGHACIQGNKNQNCPEYGAVVFAATHEKDRSFCNNGSDYHLMQ